MKVLITFDKMDEYIQAKNELSDPEMGLDDLSISVYFTDVTQEIEIFDHYDEIKSINVCGRIWTIDFVNGNSFECYIATTELDISTDFNK